MIQFYDMNAEEVREARRLKILANAEKRMQLITGQTKSLSEPDSDKISLASEKLNVSTDSLTLHPSLPFSLATTNSMEKSVRQRHIPQPQLDDGLLHEAIENASASRFVSSDAFDSLSFLNSGTNRDLFAPATAVDPANAPVGEVKSISTLHHQLAITIAATMGLFVLMNGFEPFILNSAWVPFVLVELYLQWRNPCVEPKGSLIYAALMVSGLPQATTSRLKTILSLAQRCGVDLALYLFAFSTLYYLATLFQMN